MSKTWIQTRSGVAFDLVSDDPEQVKIEDIAYALARINRFTGHSLTYSVAEHSVRVSFVVPIQDAFAGLMHDAHEAYVGDVSQPLKEAMRSLLDDNEVSQFDRIERRVEWRVAKRFGLRLPHPKSVKEADLTLLATEARDLLGPAPAPWGHVYPALAEKIEPWGRHEAEVRFLARFRELYRGS